MKRHAIVLVLAVLALVAPALRAHATPLTTAFTYQGSIDRSGILPSDSCTFQFKLFDAVTAGAQIGSTIVTPATLLPGGQFSVSLNFGVGVFDGNQRWLEVGVHCPGDGGLTTLTPRQPITATPYALYALGGAGGGGGFALPYAGALTNTTQDAFRVQNNGTTGSFSAIHGLTATTSGSAAGVFGEATGTSGGTIGVAASATASPGGTAFVGQGGATGAWLEALSASGDCNGAVGVSHSATAGAAGLKGQSWATSGNTVGVIGQAVNSASGTGVSGTGAAYGVQGSGPIGIRGAVTGGGGLGIGVLGVGDGGLYGVQGISSTSVGVYGNGVTQGVRGFSTTGHGVEGVANAATGVGVYGRNAVGDGIWGQSDAANQSGVVGWATNAAGYGGFFYNASGGAALRASGLAQVNTLQILGADLAESFPVEGDGAEPGTVMAIAGSGDGTLRVCDEAYCHRVAGVVSGAHGLAAGVVLKGEAFDQPDHAAVAMSGRVWVKCDATRAAIRVGDLLTTSARAGHAMRVSDPSRATGAILGKAMTSLEGGTGLVLVLVSLQ
jgi:hypothetical protein